MKISLDWLSDFVDLSGISAETMADKLTMSTAETEAVIVVSRSVRNIIIGELVEAEEVENDNSLKKVTVDCGKRLYTTICTAPNVRVGMKAPFAPAGTVLATGTRISEVSAGGIVSQGVLCSAKELGLSAWHEELFECPDEIQNGSLLSEFIPDKDILIEIDNKSLTHRPDLWGHYGFARELAAIFDRPLKPLETDHLSAYDSLEGVPVTIEDYDACPCYTCIGFKTPVASPSPLIIQRRLHALGQRTFNILVDITNYVMFELGQPTHAFDRNKVSHVRIARMGKDVMFTPIDGQQRKMVADDLMIWDGNTPIAIAGIMGGANSEVTDSTREILLESANFRGVVVRRTALRLNLRTEASQRFEKDQPPVNAKMGVGRILQLLKRHGLPLEVTTRFNVAGDLHPEFRPIMIAADYISKKAGVHIMNDDMSRILHSIGFKVEYHSDNRICISIPPFRSNKDISIPEDIVEEVLRIYGYDRIHPVIPEAKVELGPQNIPLIQEHKARRVLSIGHGFIEVHTYSWFDDFFTQKIGFQPKNALELVNPSASQNRFMRTILIPNILALLEQNRVHRDNFKLFEVGRVFRSDNDNRHKESTQLAGIIYKEGKGNSLAHDLFLDAKGTIEDISAAIDGPDYVYQEKQNPSFPWESTDMCVEILDGGHMIGEIGILDKKLKEILAPNGQTVWFSLDFSHWTGNIFPTSKYKPLPRFPMSWHDFSIIYNTKSGYARLEDILKQFEHPLLTKCEFLYSYSGKGLPDGKSSYTFRFWLLADDHTLGEDEIEDFRDKFMSFLEDNKIMLR